MFFTKSFGAAFQICPGQQPFQVSLKLTEYDIKSNKAGLGTLQNEKLFGRNL